MISRDQTAVFRNHIRERACKYFPGFGSEQIRVELLNKQERPTALLYRFAVSNEAQIRSVYVKVPRHSSSKTQVRQVLYEKPLLYPKADTKERPRLQYTALKTIYDYFTCLDKEQLGAIRVLDYLPQHNAIFTEGSNDTALRHLFLRKNRFSTLFTSHELISAFHNAGTWLRVYHAIPKMEDVYIRHSNRDEYVESITRLTDFLAKTLGSAALFKESGKRITNKACEVLPQSLPLGLGHGDYALRNIFIGENVRVTVFDTFSKWRTPIYEDIGYFLNELKMTSPQVISQGLVFKSDQLAAYENAFLKGYFGDKPIPYTAIRLYEILALLDKWSSIISRYFQQPILVKIGGLLKIIMINRYFKRRTKSLLAEIVKT